MGELPTAPRLAIVGSRGALHRLADLAIAAMPVVRDTARSVVSGGALGIDAAVHRAALADGVAQLAVLPCGPDRPYPPDHASLFAAIACAPGSGVVYAQPPGTAPHRAMFVSRNALTIAASDACVVLQADARSGSEATGRLALRARKPLAVVLGSVGCDALAAAGAQVLPADRDGFTDALAAWLRGEALVRQWPAHLVELRDAITAAGPRGATLDRLGGPRAALALFEAAALGLVVEHGGGRWTALA
jgi:DNA processing protein